MKSFVEAFAVSVVVAVIFITCVKSQFENFFQNGNFEQDNQRGAFALNYPQQINSDTSSGPLADGPNSAFIQNQFNSPQYGVRQTPPRRGKQSNHLLADSFPGGHSRRHWRSAHRAPPHRYRDFASVFHELERKWEPDSYNSSAEEDDINDDFSGRSIVAPGQYPHMVALGFHRNSNKNSPATFRCGGSLISDIFVLTAAHCCDFNGEAPQVVKLGDINLRAREIDIRPQRIFIAQYYVHPDYNSTCYYNDVALIQLRKPVDYTRYVRPIRLWANHEIPYEKVFTMGYGSTSFAHAPTNILTELDLTIVPGLKCNQTLSFDESAPFGIVESQICAKDFEKNRDTCQGDSGGPLQLNLEPRRRRRRYRYYLVGIISYGEFCRSPHPGVYTRVSSYIDWIASIVWPDYFKDINLSS